MCKNGKYVLEPKISEFREHWFSAWFDGVFRSFIILVVNLIGLVSYHMQNCLTKICILCTKCTCIFLSESDLTFCFSAGGIELLAKQGRIKVVNTLESRLEMMSRQVCTCMGFLFCASS